MKKLVIDDPSMMLDWDWYENDKEGLNPKCLSAGSNKKAHWKCHVCGNTWTTRIERKHKGSLCKRCLAKSLSVASKEKSIATMFPEIAAEWDYSLNQTTPDKVFPNSNKKYHWVCAKGHRWEATAAHRTSRLSLCPYCSNRRVLEGFNDLATTHPSLLNEWDFEKNDSAGIFPTAVTYGSEVEPYWKCKRGHSWRCAIYRRATYEEGCPECSKERKTSFPEKVIAHYLSMLFPDCVENYRLPDSSRLEIDVFIPSLGVGVEYDGSQWHKNASRDAKKDISCQRHGITLFRVREKGCPEYESIAHVVWVRYHDDCDLASAIKEIVESLCKQFGLTKTVDIDLERDRAVITAKSISMVKEKSIANSTLIMNGTTKRIRVLTRL